MPKEDEFIIFIGTSRIFFILAYDALLYTIKVPLFPLTKFTAFSIFTIPVPCVKGSFSKSVAVDIKIFFILNGSYSLSCCTILSISTAAEPETSGADMLVPPKIVNGSVAFLIFFVTLEGIKLYAPILIRSGFGSPIIPGPLLEKSAISFDDVVVFPNLG